MKKEWLIISLFILLGIAGTFLLFKEAAKPLPGQAVADLGREHVSDGTKVEYNSNPPTSGRHYGDWTRAGVYEQPISDGHLIHALEHGYIIISYNCMKLNSKIKSHKQSLSSINSKFLIGRVYAHEEELSSTSSAVASPSAELQSEVWSSSKCQELKKNLSDLANEKKLSKLIVIPRPNLDSSIALTAWTRIDKFNEFDKERIVHFIDTFRDSGPEKTVE